MNGQSVPRLLLAAFILGLVLRAATLVGTIHLPTRIVDEQQYSQLASSLVNGDGLAWGPGQLTSIRPPLYSALVAAVWIATGSHSLLAVRILQVVLSLLTAGLVYALGVRLFDRKVAAVAAAVYWLYPSFIFYDALILTETLFTFLLVLSTFLIVRLLDFPRILWALACGVSIGLAALTRSVLWPIPVALCPVLVLLLRGPLGRRLLISALVLAGYTAVVAPWAVRNTRLQGVPEVVDTMGGLNLRMGNYEYTPDDRMWAAVDLTGEQNWAYPLFQQFPTRKFTEGEKDKWAQHEALVYMREHPATTLRRSLIKFADLVGLEREFVAGVQQGLYSPPKWFAVLAGVGFGLAFPLVAVAGAVGLWLATPSWRQHILVLLPLLTIVAGHVLAFGHSRYHLPLVPILILYGVAFVANARSCWRAAGALPRLGAAVSVVILFAAWFREVLVVDADRIHQLLARFL